MSRPAILILLLLSSCEENEPGALEFDPLELDFGDVEPTLDGGQTKLVTLRNSSALNAACSFGEPLSEPFATPVTREFLLNSGSTKDIPITFRPTDGLLHLGTLKLTSSDGSCNVSLPMRGLGSGVLVAQPQQLIFKLGVGERQTRELRVESSRRTPTPISLRWVTNGSPFTYGTPQGLTVPASRGLTIEVDASPTTWDPTNAVLRITGAGQELNVLAVYVPSSPQLEARPRVLDVPRVPVGEFAERTFRIGNVGMSGDFLRRLEITQIISSDPVEVDIVAANVGGTLFEGSWEDVRLRVRPTSPGPKNYRVLIAASPSFVEPIEVTISTIAEVLQPCTMEVAPVSLLVLGDAADGGLEGRVTFTNRGTTRCLIDNPGLDAGTSGFAITAGGGSQIEVLPAGTHEVSIAGARLPAGSIVGAFGFHVFRDGGAEEWIEVRAP